MEVEDGGRGCGCVGDGLNAVADVLRYLDHCLGLGHYEDEVTLFCCDVLTVDRNLKLDFTLGYLELGTVEAAVTLADCLDVVVNENHVVCNGKILDIVGNLKFNVT